MKWLGHHGLRRWGVMVAALLVLAVGALAASPSEEPGLRHTSVLNAIFAARWMVGTVRVVAVVATAYVLASVMARAQHGEWLKRLGSADVDTETVQNATETLAEQSDDKDRELDEARSTIGVLRQQLADATAFIEAHMRSQS